MRSVGRISGRSFQFLTGRGKRGFGLFSLLPIFFGIYGQLLDRPSQTHGNEMTGDNTAEQKQSTRATDAPAQPAQLRDPIGQWINANFVGRRKDRIRVEPFVKEQMRRSIDANVEVVLGAVAIPEHIADLARERVLRRF